LPQLPAQLRELLSRTQYSRIVNAAVALAKPPDVPYAGYALPDVVPARKSKWSTCALPIDAQMHGMTASSCGTAEFRRLDANDESVKRKQRNCGADLS